MRLRLELKLTASLSKRSNCHGHREAELAALAHPALRYQFSTMSLDDALGDVKAQAGAGRVAFLDGPVAFEDMRQLFGRDTLAGSRFWPEASSKRLTVLKCVSINLPAMLTKFSITL